MKKVPFYELVLMVRPDASPKQVFDITQAIQDIIVQENGSIAGTEYWGFRTLAYRVAKRAKAHYVYMAFSMPALDRIYKYLKFHVDVLRFLCLKEEQKNVVLPTPLFYSTLDELIHSSDTTPKGVES